jgi:drug/metabolite transporter (DMT)-like permease
VAALLGVVVLGERLTAVALGGLILVGLAIVILAAGRRRGPAGQPPGRPG